MKVLLPKEIKDIIMSYVKNEKYNKLMIELKNSDYIKNGKWFTEQDPNAIWFIHKKDKRVRAYIYDNLFLKDDRRMVLKINNCIQKILYRDGDRF